MALGINTLLANTGDMALKRRAKRILTEINPKPGDKILDIGCGDGYYLHLLRNLEPKTILTGTDFDPKGLAKAKINLGGEIKLVQADLMKKTTFKTGEFDKAVMSEVAEHLPDDVLGLKEVNRILKPGGTLCLTVPNANYPFLWDPINRILEIFGTHIKSGFFAGIWNQHIRLYTPDEVESVLKKAGFEIEKKEALTFWCLPFNHYLVNLVARYLHVQFISGNTNNSLSKFNTKASKGYVLDFCFWLVNIIDRLNDIWQPGDQGVAVFIKARKKK